MTRSTAARRTANEKPYAMVGAGELTSAIWKSGDAAGGWRYSFNVFRLSANGRIGQRFYPHDLARLLKLARVIAAVLADDGCLPAEQRAELERLAALIDPITDFAE
jgi:hypothetical protein